MSQKEIVMKLWTAMSQLTRIRQDLTDCGHELRNWQLERIGKGLQADPYEMIDAVCLVWQAETMEVAKSQIEKIHERLESDMILNEV